MSNCLSKMSNPPRYFDASNLIPEIRTFYDNIFEDDGNVKYRSIPVTKTLDTLKASGVLCDNACGVKEVKNIGTTGSNYYPNANSLLADKYSNGFPKHLSKLDTQPALKIFRRKMYFEHGPTDKRGHGSVSEPALLVAKDRGDSIPFPYVYNDEKFAIDNFGDDKKLQQKEKCLKACIYIKKEGQVYKSKIEAINFEPEASDVFDSKQMKQKYVNSESPTRGSSNKKLDKFSREAEKNSFKIDEESDDFEIAILLTGVKNFSVGGQIRQPDTKIKGTKKEIRKVKKGVKEHNTKNTKDKMRLETQRKKYYVPSKMLKVDQSNEGSCSRLTYTVRKPRMDLDFSSKESDSDYEYDECENVVKRRPKLGVDHVFRVAKAVVKSGRSGNLQSRYTSDGINVSSSKMSQSSISQLSDIYKFQKPKICDVVMWERFEIIFRNYATTSRHSGEVIPRKISTQWMMNAGVVDEFLSDQAADDAFKNAAGAKITMNAQEYKGFLIMLSLRLKLPYYEIYRRMCGL